MISIKSFKGDNPKELAELIDLILYCQNEEANLGIKVAKQSDILTIEKYYHSTGGNFWITQENGRVIGSIALLKLNKHVGVLKKFFTYPEYRGRSFALGWQLYSTFLDCVKTEE